MLRPWFAICTCTLTSLAVLGVLVERSSKPATFACEPQALLPAAAIDLALKPYWGPLVTVEGRIGKHEAAYLFDTGGGATVISLATAKAVGCEPFGRGTGFSHDGKRSDGQRGGPLELQLGAYRRLGEVGVFDIDSMLAGLPPVGGIISLETFATAAITVDLPGRHLIVESRQSLAARTQGLPELCVRPARQAGGAALDLFVAIEGVHGPLWFELDSGNVAPVLIAPHAFVELGIDPPPADRSREAQLTLRGLGPITCEIQSKEMIYDGLLNAKFFERYVVTLDLAESRAWVSAVASSKR